MSENLENSAVATGLEKISFHSNPKKRQCQIYKYLYKRRKTMLADDKQERQPVVLFP